MATLEVQSVVTGSVWKIEAKVGQKLEPGDSIMILESMKMEIPVIAEDGGTVKEIRVEEGVPVPDRILPYAQFMQQVGTIKTRPASWKELFFPEVHDLAGS